MEEEVEAEEIVQEIAGEPEIKKVFIRDYGNIVLEIIGSNEIGVQAYSDKRDEEMFIPWTSIMFLSSLTENKHKDEEFNKETKEWQKK